MPNLRAAINDICSLEELSEGTSPLHMVDARAKIAGTFFYIAALLSCGRYELSASVPFALYPAVALAAADIPPGMILKRSAAALPFCLFAAASSVFFDKTPLFSLMGITISAGWVIFFTIMLRSFLCVSAVLVLIATTPMYGITRAMRVMRLPETLVFLFEMTWRYAGTLADETLSMRTAYALRGGSIKMKDMGTFAGQLLLKSLARAERVSAAIKCRGGMCGQVGKVAPMLLRDYTFLALVCGFSFFFRAVNVPRAIGEVLACLF